MAACGEEKHPDRAGRDTQSSCSPPPTHTPPSVPVPLRADHESQMAQALRTDELPGLVLEGDGGDGNNFFLQYFFKMREIEFAREL